MAKRMLVVRNPKAGSFLSQNTFLEAAGVIFKDESFNVYVYTTTGRGDATRIAREEGPGVDRIVAFGGDGTLSEVINGVMHLPAKDRPELGYIPAGTTNDFASGVGLSRNIVKAAQTVLTGIPEPLDVGRFGEERYFSYVASFGSFTKASYSASQDLKNALGYAAYLLEGLRCLIDIRSIPLVVTADGTIYEDEFIFGAVSNAMSVGGMLKYAYEQVNLSDGLFEVLMIRTPKNLSEIQTLLTDVANRNFVESPHILYQKARKVCVRSDSPLAWTVDGESGGETTEVTLVNHKRAINILTPKEKEYA
jgi:YegS/Rv2252/BmrU family lipid kinase